MPCYHPIPARREDDGPWTLNPQLGTANSLIPCGTCLGCRTYKQVEWTNRSIHEARLWRHNRFLTLTYDDEHLPPELTPIHLTNFLKRLRKACSSNDESIQSDRSASIRYLACGEYGGNTQRPHYHLSLFNCAPRDEQLYSKTKNGELHTSATIDAIWGMGATKLSPFTPRTAGYVAGYLTKDPHRVYRNADGHELHPPFRRVSTRPAIGLEWLTNNMPDVSRGYFINDGKKTTLPRYYVKQILKKHEAAARLAEREAFNHLAPLNENQEPERLKAAQIIHEQKIQHQRRQL